MKKVFAILLSLALLAGAAVWAVAAGDASDPLVSLSYLTGKFTATVDTQVDKALDASDKALKTTLQSGEALTPTATTWTETILKKGDTLSGETGVMVLPLAGTVTVTYNTGAVVNVSTGKVVTSGSTLTANNTYLVAEDTWADFTVASKTAVLDYQGTAFFKHSAEVDYPAMASALKQLNLFKGSFTGYGQGFDLEDRPSRLQALIMFIRVLGEEEAALSWTGTTPFTDVTKGSQAEQYIGYAYEKGYTNGYTATTWKPSNKVNAYQYTEFVLRAMGYSSVANTDLSDVFERARTAGVLTAGEASTLMTATFCRTELVYVSWYALGSYMPDGMSTLAGTLMSKGVFTSADWNAARALVTGARM